GRPSAGHRRHGAAILGPWDAGRAEKAAPAGDEHLHPASSDSDERSDATNPPREKLGALFSDESQSTRPIQRSRLAAYHAIVRATPSSQVTLGDQPVSRLSFS